MATITLLNGTVVTISAQKKGRNKINGKYYAKYSVVLDGEVCGEVCKPSNSWLAYKKDGSILCYTYHTREKAIEALVEAAIEVERAEIEAAAAEAEVAAQVAADNTTAPASMPTHVNVEINKRMHTTPASLFDMQTLATFARCMPINAHIFAKSGDIYFLWGASEFPAFMAEDGSAEIWAFPDTRPCRWLSISLGNSPRPAFVVENYDDDEQRAEFYREDAMPF